MVRQKPDQDNQFHLDQDEDDDENEDDEDDEDNEDDDEEDDEEDEDEDDDDVTPTGQDAIKVMFGLFFQCVSTMA